MPGLPSGTVTFLFTDIEGSTRLLQQLGDCYTSVLADHHRLLRAVFQEFGGHEVDTQGDACFVTFGRARDAIAAAIEGQRVLARHPWPEGAIVRVRMGLHTGEPLSAETGYVGMDVHRAARISDAGHGGQILLSDATRTLVEEDLPLSITLRDLGSHRLKDLSHPQHLFQIVIPDLPKDFPPLKSLDTLPNNLPRYLTSFVGRERELAEVKQSLVTTYLLTLTGPGGVGKTRLAVQVAAEVLDDHPDGVWLAELGALTDAGLIPQTLAKSLGVREEPTRPLLTTLSDCLQAKRLLLILDNCEHLVEPCAQLVETFLRTCPHLRILATSREALGIAGEFTYRVRSLSTPDLRRMPSSDQLTQYEAVRLFQERAARSHPGFSVTPTNAVAVVQVCHRLDGIPLAIELAASRVKVLSVEQIAARMDDRFRLLAGSSRTVVPRHQTLQATMDWSYALLPDEERVLLRRLAVFAGGCTLDAVQAICVEHDVTERNVLDLLTGLVDKSLLVVEEHGGQARYRLLETIRQYGRERLLEAGESGSVRDRHLEYFLGLAQQVDREIEEESIALGDWLNRVEAEHDNLRTALEWALEAKDTEIAVQLAGALGVFWGARGYYGEGREWLDKALSRSSMTASTLRAKALTRAGGLAIAQGDYLQARALLEDGLALNRQLEDKRGVGETLRVLGWVAYVQDDYPSATLLWEEGLALARELRNDRFIARSIERLGRIAMRQGDYARAKVAANESLALAQKLGDKRSIANALQLLGIVAWNEGDFGQATTLIEQSQILRGELGQKGDWANINILGQIAYAQGDYARAEKLHEDCLAQSKEVGDKRGMAFACMYLGDVARQQRDYGRANMLIRQSLVFFREQSEKWLLARSLESMAKLACMQGKLERAATLFAAAANTRQTIGSPIMPSDRAEYDDHLATARVQLGKDRFSVVWTEGRGMTLEQAVEYALAGEDKSA